MIATPPTIGQHFAYATGRLGILERRLLDQSDIDRLIGAKSGQEAERMLGDIPFLAYQEGDRYSETLHRSVAALKKDIEGMIPQEKHFLFDILWIENDRALISFLLKKRRGFTSPIARLPEPPVTAGIAERWEELLPELTEHIFTTPQEIDEAVAEAIAKIRTTLVKRSHNAQIALYAAALDQTNGKRTALRLDGEGGDALSLERNSIAELKNVLFPMRQIVLGPEPLFAYAVRALHHIALLKILMAAKLSGMDAATIKSLLPPLL